jgi:hypothetical protein
MAASPKLAKELVESVSPYGPSSRGNGTAVSKLRTPYVKRGVSIGSLPPLAGRSRKGQLRDLNDIHVAALIDKIGERLYFERVGTRIYEGLIEKFRNAPKEASATGASLSRLEQFHEEEFRHFAVLTEVMELLGGDPTALTPSADVQGVLSMGAPQVVLDPRTSFHQCLEAILLVELVDSDGWTNLIELTQSLGLSDVSRRFEVALAEEDVHLEDVRHWVRLGMIGKVGRPPGKVSGARTLERRH